MMPAINKDIGRQIGIGSRKPVATRSKKSSKKVMAVKTPKVDTYPKIFRSPIAVTPGWSSHLYSTAQGRKVRRQPATQKIIAQPVVVPKVLRKSPFFRRVGTGVSTGVEIDATGSGPPRKAARTSALRNRYSVQMPVGRPIKKAGEQGSIATMPLKT